MSHFIEVKTTLKVLTTLKQALQSMGFTVEAVPLAPKLSPESVKALSLQYQNSFQQSQRAHVVARHVLLRDQTTAIGFRWDTEAQVYTLQCDPYEIKHSDYGATFGHVVGDDEGKPVVSMKYNDMTDNSVLTVLQQQLQIEYDRAVVRGSYSVISETYVGTAIEYVVKPHGQTIDLGVVPERV